MSAGRVIDQAAKAAAGTMGEMALALERKKPVPRDQIANWAARLRAAASILDKLTKEPPK
jgi:hypothetical protein